MVVSYTVKEADIAYSSIPRLLKRLPFHVIPISMTILLGKSARNLQYPIQVKIELSPK